MLFEQLAPTDITPDGFVATEVLTQRLQGQPDPLLAQLGGTRVDVAIGIDRNAYQLEVTVCQDSGQVTVSWVKADTVNRKVKEGGAAVPVGEYVPATQEAALKSLCTAFGLSEEEVRKKGVDLLAFWAGVEANERLELPLSRDWKRFSLAQQA